MIIPMHFVSNAITNDNVFFLFKHFIASIKIRNGLFHVNFISYKFTELIFQFEQHKVKHLVFSTSKIG
jgi:hypothetical protein